MNMKNTVLAVDDDEVFLEELGLLLTECGYEMVTVNDSAEAAGVARRIRPDVVLLDLNMPGKNGFDVAREIQDAPETRGVPIIAMSGFLGHGFIPAYDLHGIRKFIRKPFNPAFVIRAINDMLKKSGAPLSKKNYQLNLSLA